MYQIQNGKCKLETHIQSMAQLYIRTSITKCRKINARVILSRPNNEIDIYLLPMLQYTLFITLILDVCVKDPTIRFHELQLKLVQQLLSSEKIIVMQYQ